MVSVRFLQHHSPYNGGELAGFPPEEAERLVKMKVAELVTPPVTGEYVPATEANRAVTEENVNDPIEIVMGVPPEVRAAQAQGKRGSRR